MANLRDLLDAATFDQLKALGGEQIAKPHQGPPPKVPAASSPPQGSRPSELGHVPSLTRRRAVSSDLARRQAAVPPQSSPQLEWARGRVADIERRLAELSRLANKSPRANALFLTRTKNELLRDIAAVQKRLGRQRSPKRDGGPALGRALAQARQVEQRIRDVVIPSPPPAQQLPAGRALSPPRELRANTPGPDSPDYYQDPVNSK